jgi:hypothetical protein
MAARKHLNALDRRIAALGPLLSGSTRKLIGDLLAARPHLGAVEVRWLVNRVIAANIGHCGFAVWWAKDCRTGEWTSWAAPDDVVNKWPESRGCA